MAVFLMIIFAVICAAFIILIRRRRRVLSSILAVESAVLVLLFFSLSLSASGVPFMQAFTESISVWELNISSFTLILAALFAMTVFVALSALIHIAKKILKHSGASRQYCRELFVTIKKYTMAICGRKLLLMHCRLND